MTPRDQSTLRRDALDVARYLGLAVAEVVFDQGARGRAATA
jgi:hypothetical protein